MAKKLFKAYTCYKNRRNPDTPQGGLGGIGIENWILQNGGSLKKAAESFVEYARRYPDFFDFRERYQVWDFGQNHYSFEKNNYSHDNFVYGNMDYQGFEKMKRALDNYLKFGEKAFEEPLLGDSLADAQVAIEKFAKEIQEKEKSIGI